MVLLGVGLLSNPYFVFAIVVVLAVFVGGFLFRKDEAIEDKRRKAIDVANELRSQGLKHVPDLLVDYAVGDYSGMLTRIKSWSQLMGDDDQRKAFFAQFRKTQISKMLESESDRAHLMAQVDAWKAVKKSEEDAFAKKLKEQSLVASVVSA